MPNIVKYIIATAIVLVCIGGAFLIGLKMAPMLPGVSGMQPQMAGQAGAEGAAAEEEKEEEEEKEPKLPPKFHSLEKFVISIPGEKTLNYLLLEMSLQSSQEGAMDKFADGEPLVRNTLMKLFGSKPLAELKDPANVEALQMEAKDLLDSVFKSNGIEVELDNVLFTRLIIQ